MSPAMSCWSLAIEITLRLLRYNSQVAVSMCHTRLVHYLHRLTVRIELSLLLDKVFEIFLTCFRPPFWLVWRVYLFKRQSRTHFLNVLDFAQICRIILRYKKYFFNSLLSVWRLLKHSILCLMNYMEITGGYHISEPKWFGSSRD